VLVGCFLTYSISGCIKDAFWCIILTQTRTQVFYWIFWSTFVTFDHARTGKFSSDSGFRRMHDAIHHATGLTCLICWQLAAKVQNFMSLWRLPGQNPTGMLLRLCLKDLVRTYYRPELPRPPRGPRHWTWLLASKISIAKATRLLYLEFSCAMNHGDVGRILHCPILDCNFTVTGKHKYAAHMTQFMTDLDQVYPPLLRCEHILLPTIKSNTRLQTARFSTTGCVIQTSKAHGFQGYDWLMERNNLYTKVSLVLERLLYSGKNDKIGLSGEKAPVPCSLSVGVGFGCLTWK